jgi:hypothetical protein
MAIWPKIGMQRPRRRLYVFGGDDVMLALTAPCSRDQRAGTNLGLIRLRLVELDGSDLLGPA